MTGSSLYLRAQLSLRLAMRDLRGGFRGFRVFIACIALGVAAITGIGSASRVLSDSVAREGRTILGGDIAVRVVHSELTPAQAGWLEARAVVSSVATMRAMARNSEGEPALVEIKAVDGSYPLVGSVVVQPGSLTLEAALAERDGMSGLVVDSALLSRLEISVGDRIAVGDTEFEIRAELVSEPDGLALSGPFNLGPRIMMSQAAFRASGLMQPGSLIHWWYRLRLGDGAPADDAAIEQTLQEIHAAFPDSGWRIQTRANVSPGFERNLTRFAQFLTLVALTALIVGGVGVANAVRHFTERKQRDMAVMKALGARGGYIFRIMMTEVLLVAGLAIALGVVIGAAIPFLVASVFSEMIPIPFSPAVYPANMATGAVFGMLTAIAFAIAPLGRVHDAPVSRLFRDQVGDDQAPLRLRYRVLTVVVLVIFLATALALASDRRIALVFVVAAATALFVLRLLGVAIKAAARHAPRSRNPVVRMAVGNLHRPGALTQSVVLSLGLGMTMLVTLMTIDLNLRRFLQDGAPGSTPSFFFVDIQKSEVPAFERFIGDNAADARLDLAPMMRGRVVSVKGVSSGDMEPPPNIAWVLRGDRGVTYSDARPPESTIARGTWWEPGYRGPALVSVEREVAEGLGLAIGDRIVFNVLGREIEATVANHREVDWRSFGMNFVFVFSESAFAGAPHAYLATATYENPDPARELSLLREAARAFPTVTVIRVRETLETVARITEQLGFAVRGATSIALIASILVLAGAVSAGQKMRLYDVVVLKTLGATRRRILSGMLVEYSLLGAATGLFALLAGTLAAWVILTKLMDFSIFHFDWAAIGLAVAAGLVIAVLTGLIGVWRILDEKPARHLRNL